VRRALLKKERRKRDPVAKLQQVSLKQAEEIQHCWKGRISYWRSSY